MTPRLNRRDLSPTLEHAFGPTPLTQKQEDIWRFIASCDRSPTYFEIRDALGYRAIKGIQDALAKLEERGFIRRHKYARRGIELLREPSGPRTKHKRLTDYSDAELRAELARRQDHGSKSVSGRRNWMTDARIGSSTLLSAIERAGLRP